MRVNWVFLVIILLGAQLGAQEALDPGHRVLLPDGRGGFLAPQALPLEIACDVRVIEKDREIAQSRYDLVRQILDLRRQVNELEADNASLRLSASARTALQKAVATTGTAMEYEALVKESKK